MNNRNDDFATQDNAVVCATARRRPLRRVRQLVKRLWRDSRGAALLEYGMLGVLVAVFAFNTVKALGGNVEKAMKRLSDTVGELGNATAPATAPAAAPLPPASH